MKNTLRFCCWLVVLSVLCGKKWFVNKESHVVTPWLLGESKMVVEGRIMRIVLIRKHNVYCPLWRSLFFISGKMCTFNGCPTRTTLHLRVQRKHRNRWKVKNEEFIIETVDMFVSLHCRIFRLTPLNLRMGYICSPNHSMAVLSLLQKLQNTIAAFTSGLLISSNRFKSLLILLLWCLFLHFFQIHHPSSSSVIHT